MKIGITTLTKSNVFIWVLILLTALSSCKKLIDVDLPIDKNTASEVYSNSTLTAYTLTGLYARLAKYQLGNGPESSFSVLSSLMSDDLKPLGFEGSEMYVNNYNLNDGYFWVTAYMDFIYPVNSLIEGVSSSSQINGLAKDRLIGEAKFLRAWIYFYLVNYYGDVPLVLSTDFKVNSKIPRSSKQSIYEQIVNDLREAQLLLPSDYVGVNMVSLTTDRIRPNKYAATALLARVYLYQSKWEGAEDESSKIIENTMFDLAEIEKVFLKNSKETIWALQPSATERGGNINTSEGRALVPSTSRFPALLFEISQSLYSNFEDQDRRLLNWIGDFEENGVIYHYPKKYKIGNKDNSTSQEQQEYSIVLRIAEQYLIRAEARAHLGKITGKNSALEDLNRVRKRAGLIDLEVTNSEIFEAITKERRLELFTEFGHRWLDLKRTNVIDEVMSVNSLSKGVSWEPYKALLPIPASEFETNEALRGHQNPGYSEH